MRLLSARSVAAEVADHPLGFKLGDDESVPRSAHVEHRYHANCAICRAGDFPEALEAVVAAAIRTATGAMS